MRLFLNGGFGAARFGAARGMTTRVEVFRVPLAVGARYSGAVGAFGEVTLADVSQVVGMATVIINGVATIYKGTKDGEIADRQLAQLQANAEAQAIANKAKADADAKAAAAPTPTQPLVYQQSAPAASSEVPTWAWVLGGLGLLGAGVYLVRAR